MTNKQESQHKSNTDWDLIIESKSSKSSFSLNELIKYKDLIFMFVKRDFVSLYKQTILGPLWVIIQPILTTITFTVVFGKIAKIDIGEGLPPVLFYLLGITTWTYFSDCITKTSETFTANQNIFGKVYFPRLTTPLSVVITNLIKLAIQFVLFLGIYFYFILFTDVSIQISWQLALIPILIILMAFLGLGIGLIISSLTTKYRDLKFLITFGVQLAMYATPVVYPLKNVSEDYRWILQLNPMTNIIEAFKIGFFGTGNGVFSLYYLGYSALITIIIFFFGLHLFSKIEKTFMDTI